MDKAACGVELLPEEITSVSGGVTTPSEVAWWAQGTSGAFQKIMVLKLEVLGNPTH